MNGAGLFAHGWLWAYASVFVGGFLTSLTPCVYPLIPITVSLFGARGDDVPRRRAIGLASLYVAGIGGMYAAPRATRSSSRLRAARASPFRA